MQGKSLALKNASSTNYCAANPPLLNGVVASKTRQTEHPDGSVLIVRDRRAHRFNAVLRYKSAGNKRKNGAVTSKTRHTRITQGSLLSVNDRGAHRFNAVSHRKSAVYKQRSCKQEQANAAFPTGAYIAYVT